MRRRTILTAAAFIICCILISGCSLTREKKVLHVAIPWSPHVQDPATDYYIGWLEDRTGLSLDVTTVRESSGEEYLKTLFQSDADIDIVMFGEEFTISEEALEGFVRNGDVYNAGNGYFYKNTGSSLRDTAGQILWINYEWLIRLGLSIPRTTDELEQVLNAFSESDPNGNGVKDEIPLAGCADDYRFLPQEFILNAFVYNDPYHQRNKAVAYREGIAFCHRLYDEGLLDDRIWSYSHDQLCELINSPLDLVGAFTTGSISDVVYQGNPEVMARYVHVAPLIGPHGEQNALRVYHEPAVGAIITSRSSRKDEAKLLLDTMLTEEASLIARFGEKGVDWDYSEGQDVSIYGGASTIVTRNYIWNTSQNKHLNGIGPMDVPVRYIEGVTWNGVNSDAEYIDSRAQMSYRDFLPDIKEPPVKDAALSAYADAALSDFIRGIKDIGSDEEWESYLNGS